MQETVVGVQDGILIVARSDDVLVAMANMSHVVDAVQVFLALLVVHVLTFGTNYLQGVGGEEQFTRGSDIFLPQGNRLLPGDLFLPKDEI